MSQSSGASTARPSEAGTRYAQPIEQAGADALELNLYNVVTDPERSADDIETDYLTVVASVKAQLKIPVAVKLSPYFTNLARFARSLDRHGANALVLFNRFYQPDIELETLEISPNLLLSTPMAMRLPMRWIALLYGRIGANLAATSGIHLRHRCAQNAHGRRRCHDALLGAATARDRSYPSHRTRDVRMARRTRIRFGRTIKRQHEPDELPRPDCVRACPIHARALELSFGEHIGRK